MTILVLQFRHIIAIIIETGGIMAKKKTLFECQACGFQSPRWMGKCTSCDQWETMIELSTDQIKFLKETSGSSASGSFLSKAKPITQIEEDNIVRFTSGSGELDLVLGGGIVPGSLTLIGGSPGVGKSTLLLKIAGNLAQSHKKSTLCFRRRICRTDKTTRQQTGSKP